jgi:hypothetical protein
MSVVGSASRKRGSLVEEESSQKLVDDLEAGARPGNPEEAGASRQRSLQTAERSGGP